MTELGIFARTFRRPSLEETLDAVGATGLRTMQFNLALTGGPPLPEVVPDDLADRIRIAAAERGLRMAAVSGTYNMAHPDARIRGEGLRRLGVLVAAAPRLGTGVVTLCTGSRDPGDMWRHHPDNATPEAWSAMLASLQTAVELAEAHGVLLAFEPEHHNVVGSAPAGRRLLDEIRSPSLRVVLDPANLFAGGDLARQRDTLREAFDLLGDDLVLAHAKDVREDGTLVAAGQGELDYDEYLGLLAGERPDVPLILHGLAEEEVPASVGFLRGRYARTL